MRLILPASVAVLCVGLGGCHALREDTCFDHQLYERAKSIAPLHAAEGLGAPNTKNALKIPDAVAEPKARSPKDGCLDRPPSFYADRPKTPAVAK